MNAKCTVKKELQDLVISDTITVDGEQGTCRIELCLGSVTALKAEDKVDALVVSAFNGCYAPTQGSVIGALFNDLDLSVSKLSKDKEEDLRLSFSCWWSKPLPKKLPYNRILCFEGNFKKDCKPPATISEVFRSLVSLSKNKDLTAMMPLLASGAQGYTERRMLNLIADAAINWMLAGLPLRVLKIVIYTHKPLSPDARVQEVAKQFTKLKEKWNAKWKEEQVQKSIAYDVYLSYSPADKPYVEMIKALMKQENSMLRIHDEHQEVDTESSWQEEIYDVIITCSRVIALLSPDYIQEAACIEQFNIAMCRSRKKNMLVPFYVKEIVQMPTYIGLIQYLDCRSLENTIITSACITVITSISSEQINPQTASKKPKQVTAASKKEQYDIFISYCHQDMEVAVKVVDMIKNKLGPKFKIFFDQNDLKVGTTWQNKLYSSVENSRFMVALLSESYLNSKVCQEEYNLAYAMHVDPQYPITLYDIKLSAVETWPTWCHWSQMFDLSKEVFVVVISKLIERLRIEVKKKKEDVPSPKPIQERTESFRTAATSNNFPIITKTSFADYEKLREIGDAYQSNSTYDVILSYHADDEKYSKTLVQNLGMFFPNIKISLPDPESDELRLHLFDQCKIIVPLLSQSYVASPERMEELHTALCRHRFSNEIILFPIILEILPPTPVFPNLIFTLFNVTDKIWRKKGGSPSYNCLNAAAVVIGNILTLKPRVQSSFRTLLSIRELDEWTEAMASDKPRNDNQITNASQLPLCYYSKNNSRTVEVSSLETNEEEENNENDALKNEEQSLEKESAIATEEAVKNDFVANEISVDASSLINNINSDENKIEIGTELNHPLDPEDVKNEIKSLETTLACTKENNENDALDSKDISAEKESDIAARASTEEGVENNDIEPRLGDDTPSVIEKIDSDENKIKIETEMSDPLPPENNVQISEESNLSRLKIDDDNSAVINQDVTLLDEQKALDTLSDEEFIKHALNEGEIIGSDVAFRREEDDVDLVSINLNNDRTNLTDSRDKLDLVAMDEKHRDCHVARGSSELPGPKSAFCDIL